MNGDPASECSSVCLNRYCGNGVVDPEQQCDDENVVGGDGCSADCQSDVADPDCSAPPAEICGDGFDNDCDGLVDCADSDCTGAPEWS